MSADATWVPVVVEHDEVSDTLEVLRRLRVELRPIAGADLLTPEQAVVRFNEAHSRPAHAPSAAELHTWKEEAAAGLSAAALGEWAKAAETLERFNKLPSLARDSLLATDRLGRDVLDLCMMVGAHRWEQGDESSALDTLDQCSGGLPTLVPESRYLTDPVKHLMAAARGRLDPVALEVLVSGTEDLCEVLVSGHKLGPASKALPPLPRGQSVRLQVRCDGVTSRVHEVQLNAPTQQVTVDPRFDAAVVATRYLGLAFDSASAARNRAAQAALRVAKPTDADEALLADRVGPHTLRLTRLNLAQRSSTARIDLPIPASADQLAAAARALSADQQPGTLALEATPIGASDAPSGPSTLALAVGLTAAAGGAVATVFGWSFAQLQNAYGDRLAADARYLSRYETAAKNGALSTLIGTTLRTTAVPLLLPDRELAPALPWLGLTVGALGLGTGAVLTAAQPSCFWTCTNGEATQTGPFLIAASVPFLAIPATYLIRDLLGERAAASVHVSGTSGSITLQSAF